MGSELLVDSNDISTYGSKVNFRKVPDHLKELIGKMVKIIKGNYKGHVGILRSVNDRQANVELSAKNKIINIDASYIAEVNKDTSSIRPESIMSTPRSTYGPKTPAYYPQSPTFNPTSPAWNPSATPNYWGVNSPNPHR